MDSKLEKIRNMVHSLKEEPTMSVGAGGYTSAAAASGPVAGYDTPIAPVKKRYVYGGKNSRKRWMKKDERK